jgi:hypothetical protein
MEEEASARGGMHAAILEKQRSDEELRLLVDRCEAAESERETLRRQVDRLQAGLDKTTTQRDNHCAHAEILLKEKNRSVREPQPPTRARYALNRNAAHLCPACPSRRGLPGLAGVTTRPAGYPRGGVPPAAERQLHLLTPCALTRYSKEVSTLKKELEAVYRAACDEADALARSARAVSARPASRVLQPTCLKVRCALDLGFRQHAHPPAYPRARHTTRCWCELTASPSMPRQENNRRVVNTMAAHVAAHAAKKPAPAPHAFSHLELPWTAERDGLVERVKGCVVHPSCSRRTSLMRRAPCIIASHASVRSSCIVHRRASSQAGAGQGGAGCALPRRVREPRASREDRQEPRGAQLPRRL